MYAGAVGILFLVPGPVWAALIARALSGGFHSAWPLAVGVVVGDFVWPVLAVFGVSYLISVYADFLTLLKMGGALMLAFMGLLVVRRPDRLISSDSRLTAPGAWAGFSAGILIIMGNPKAVIFYMGVLPGFFDLTQVNLLDIAAIATVSMLVPLLGNVMLAAFVDRARLLVSSDRGIRRINQGSGWALIIVGILIALS